MPSSGPGPVYFAEQIADPKEFARAVARHQRLGSVLWVIIVIAAMLVGLHFLPTIATVIGHAATHVPLPSGPPTPPTR